MRARAATHSIAATRSLSIAVRRRRWSCFVVLALFVVPVVFFALAHLVDFDEALILVELDFLVLSEAELRCERRDVLGHVRAPMHFLARRGMNQAEPPCVQRLTREIVGQRLHGTLAACVSVHRIAEQRMLDMRAMDPNLMRAARFEIAMNRADGLTVPRGPVDGAEVRTRGLARCRLHDRHARALA